RARNPLHSPLPAFAGIAGEPVEDLTQGGEVSHRGGLSNTRAVLRRRIELDRRPCVRFRPYRICRRGISVLDPPSIRPFPRTHRLRREPPDMHQRAIRDPLPRTPLDPALPMPPHHPMRQLHIRDPTHHRRRKHLLPRHHAAPARYADSLRRVAHEAGPHGVSPASCTTRAAASADGGALVVEVRVQVVAGQTVSRSYPSSQTLAGV